MKNTNHEEKATWYYAFAIIEPDGTYVNAGFDLDMNAANLIRDGNIDLDKVNSIESATLN